MLQEFVFNFTHNLFKPLLLFFYAGFFIPVLGVKFEFPKSLYQSITIYLLLAIGWHGGEELAGLSSGMLGQALGFMLIGFCTNFIIGFAAYGWLRLTTRIKQVDAATVAGYYGSDSAGTFVTCLGVLTAGNIAYAAYMPVMLAIMEIPGCLVALILVSKMRQDGMDAAGNMPGEVGYIGYRHGGALPQQTHLPRQNPFVAGGFEEETAKVCESQLVGATATSVTRTVRKSYSFDGGDQRSHMPESAAEQQRRRAEKFEDEMALQSNVPEDEQEPPQRSKSVFSKELLHEVFFNPGIYLLFAGIMIGFISRLQGEKVSAADDPLFVLMFQGILCMFLLEMGMTASRKLRDLRTAGWRFVAFALLAPNVFATFGMCIAHGYSLFLGRPFELGTYALFAVLCGAASYIALPAVQRMAIPEASPTLPLAASLGVTFSYNVTVGIPVYLLIAQMLTRFMPIYSP